MPKAINTDSKTNAKEIQVARATLASTLLAAATASVPSSRKRGSGSDSYSGPLTATAVQPNATDLSSTDRKRRKSSRDIACTPSYHRRCFTGFTSLDEEVLEAGLNYGQGGMVALAGEKVGWGLEIAFSTLASHLIAASSQDRDGSELSCRSRAYFIDTSRSFDPRRLLKILMSQLRSRDRAERATLTHSGGFVYARSGSECTDGNLNKSKLDIAAGDQTQFEKEAMQMMDRVEIIRVFDFEGLFEAVDEVKRRLGGDEGREEEQQEDYWQAHTGLTKEVESARQSTDVVNQSSAGTRTNALSEQQSDSAITGDDSTRLRLNQPQTRLEVRVQVEDSDNEDDEMLLSPVPTSPIERKVEKVTDAKDARPSQTESPSTTRPNDPPSGHLKESRHVHGDQPQPAAETLLLISSLPRILSAPMYTTHVRAHALLVGLMRQVQRLTLAHPLCVLMLNGTVSGGGTGDLGGVQEKEEGPSAFARSGGMKPAGGKTLDWFLDLSLLVSDPGEREINAAGEKSGRRCLVEVLHDREGGRVGRWCALDL